MIIRVFGIAILGVVAGGGYAGESTHLNLADWEAAACVHSDDIRHVAFEGFPNQTSAEGIDFGPGAMVAPYGGTQIYPRIDNDSPFGGGWLVNRNNPGFDEFLHSIRIDFSVPVVGVCCDDNPNEWNQLRLYDENDVLVAELINNSTQDFLGIVTDTPIAYATVINLPPEDGQFAIDNLRFAVLPTCLSDADNSGSIGVSDLLALLGSWGACGQCLCGMDINQSGAVDVQDLLALLGAWGDVCAD